MAASMPGFGFCPIGAEASKSTVNLYGTASYISGDSIFYRRPILVCRRAERGF